MRSKTPDQDPGLDAEVAIIAGRSHLATALTRFLSPRAVLLTGGGTTTIAGMGELGVRWGLAQGDLPGVLLLAVEVSHEGEPSALSSLNGVKLGQTIQAALPNLTILHFGVMPKEQVRHRTGSSTFEYVDLITQSAELPKRILALLAVGREQARIRPVHGLPSGALNALDVLRCDLAPALDEGADEAMIEAVVVGACAAAGWQEIQADCAGLVIPIDLERVEATRLRQLRARLVGLGAMVRGVAGARGAPARRHLVTEYLARIDLVRQLLEHQERQR